MAQKINQFYPLPNQAPSNPFTNANNYLASVSLNTTMQQYTTRLDHRFSDNDTFFGRYTYFVNYTDNGTAAPWPRSGGSGALRQFRNTQCGDR